MLVEANICPLCLEVFQDSKELLKHVFQTHHVSLQPPCQICLEHCQHQNEAVINKDTNENVRIKTEPLELNESQNEQQSEICDTKENVKIEPKEIYGTIQDRLSELSNDYILGFWVSSDDVAFHWLQQRRRRRDKEEVSSEMEVLCYILHFFRSYDLSKCLTSVMLF